MSTTKTSQNHVPVLERALFLMEHLQKHPEGLGISDIAVQLEIPKNTVFRIINTLHDHNYVTRDADSKRYTLSHKLFSMVYNGVEEKGLMENALDVMRAMRDELKETCLISIISDNQGLVLEQVPGLHPFRFAVDPGTRRSLHGSSHGKAILAFLPDDMRNEILHNLTYKKYTQSTIVSEAALLEELGRVRERGYAFDLAEEAEGVHCVSAPILNRQGVAVAALTTTGPAFRMPLKELDRIGHCIKDHAARVSRRFGYGLV